MLHDASFCFAYHFRIKTLCRFSSHVPILFHVGIFHLYADRTDYFKEDSHALQSQQRKPEERHPGRERTDSVPIILNSENPYIRI